MQNNRDRFWGKNERVTFCFILHIAVNETVVLIGRILFSEYPSCLKKAILTHQKLINCDDTERDKLN